MLRQAHCAMTYAHTKVWQVCVAPLIEQLSVGQAPSVGFRGMPVVHLCFFQDSGGAGLTACWLRLGKQARLDSSNIFVEACFTLFTHMGAMHSC